MIHHLRFTFRMLAANRGFAAAAVLALALGIGPNTAIFSVVYANLLAPMPYPHPDQLVMVWSKEKGNRNQVAPADFLDWRRQASSFQQMAAFFDQGFNLSSAQEPAFVPGERVSTNWYKLLGEEVWLGRDFRADEDQPGKDHVFILSHKCWASRFGGDRSIIGKQFRLNGEPYTAIGVMPPGPSDRHAEEIWVPLRFSRAELERGATFWFVLGRLKSGVSIQQAQQQMNAVTRRISELYPATNEGMGASLEPLKNDFLSPSTRTNLWLLLATVSFVLLIACVNVANLLLARGAGRQTELAVRAALGASRAQLVWQLLAESLTLAALGGALGTWLSAGLLQAIIAILPPGTLSSEAEVRLSWPVLLFTLATTFTSGILFGCAPAWQAKNADLNQGLKGGGRSAVCAGRGRLRQWLVIVEFGLALTLLAGAALTVRSFANRIHVDLGVRTDHVLTFHLPMPGSRLAEPRQTDIFYRELLARLEAVPGVERAAATTSTPLQGSDFDMEVRVEGQQAANSPRLSEAGFQPVTPGYFETFGVRLTAGRIFNARDSANSPRVAMVNEAFVRGFLKGHAPLSQRLFVEQLRNGVLATGPSVRWQIVGVFHDVQNNERMGEANHPEIYVPFAQSPWPQALVAVRTALPPEKMMKAVAAAAHSLAPDVPLVNVQTMEQIAQSRFVDDRFGMALYGSMAGIALLLASLGIYGVMSFTVAQGTAEIGLRMALGASPEQVLFRILKHGLAMAGAGLGLGLMGAYFIGRAMQSILYGTDSMDWSALGMVAALLLGAALLACYFPARRASAVDPMVALRQR